MAGASDWAGLACPLACARTCSLLRRAPCSGKSSPALARAAALGLDASAQGVHKVDDLCFGRFFRRFDLLTRLLLPQKLLQRLFVVVFELLWLEMAGPGAHDVRGQFQHVLWDLLVGDVVKIFRLLAHL